jgi:hypothetical protein
MCTAQQPAASADQLDATSLAAINPCHLPSLQGGAAALDPDDRPACLRCSQPMHYIGAVESDCFSDDFSVDALVHLFYCADCKLQCCLDQPK